MLNDIADQLVRQLKAWLDQPSETSAQIDDIRAKIEQLGKTIPTDAMKATLKTLADAEREARRLRQREAAEAIAESCRSLGVILEPKAPPKRAPRKRRAKKSEAAEQTGTPATSPGRP